MTNSTKDIFNGCAFKMGAIDCLFKAISKAQLLPSDTSSYGVINDSDHVNSSNSILIQHCSSRQLSRSTPFEYTADEENMSFHHYKDLSTHDQEIDPPENFQELLVRCYDDFLSKFNPQFIDCPTEEDRFKHNFLARERNNVIDLLMQDTDPTEHLNLGWSRAKPALVCNSMGRAQVLSKQ